MIKVNDIVEVYEDPITKTKLEGAARVVEIYSVNAKLMSGMVKVVCQVQFSGESKIFTRALFIETS